MSEAMTSQPEDGLLKRYSARLGVEVFGLFLSFLTMGIVPRSLGPRLFGIWNYLVDVFSQATSLFDSGISTGLINQIIRELNDSRTRRVFFQYVALFCFVFFVSLAVLGAFGLRTFFSADSSMSHWIFVAFYVVANWVSLQVNRLVDAHGVTVAGERVRLASKIGIFLGLVGLGFKHWLTVETLAILYVLVALFQSYYWLAMLARSGVTPIFGAPTTLTQAKDKIGDIWHYSSPLVIYSIFGFAFSVVDRWLLQHFGGSENQGFYGLGFHFASILFAPVSPITPLLIRDLTRMHASNRPGDASKMLKQYLTAASCFLGALGAFAMVHATEIVSILGGSRFLAATHVLAVLSFYPASQVFGQFANAGCLAFLETRIIRNMGFVFGVVGAFSSYAILKHWTSFSMAPFALALAIKTVVLGFIQPMTTMVFLFRAIREDYAPVLVSFGGSTISAVGLAFTAKLIARSILPGSQALYLIAASGVIEAAFIYVIAFGITKKEPIGVIRAWVVQSLLSDESRSE